MDPPIDDPLNVRSYTNTLPNLEGYILCEAYDPDGQPGQKNIYFYKREPPQLTPPTTPIRSAPVSARRRAAPREELPDRGEVPGSRPPEKKRPICFQNKSMNLTYKTHLDKGEYKEWFRDIVREHANDAKIKFLELAHETGDKENPYPHTHVHFQLTQPLISRKERLLDYQGIHPNWTYVNTKKHMENSIRYLAKEDPENAHLLEDTDDISGWKAQVEAAPTLRDALRDTQCKPSDVGGLQAYYNICKQREVKPRLTIAHMLRWQKQVIDIMNINSAPKGDIPVIVDPGVDTEDPNCPIPGLDTLYHSLSERFIRVIYDPIGGSGKTALVKALYHSDPTRFLPIQGVPQLRDFSTIVQDAIASGWSGDCILFNLTRQQEDYKIHSTIEAAVDAFCTSTKYRGQTAIWQAHNIWLFTNTIPNPYKVSLDRWKYYEVSADFSKCMMSHLRPMSLSKAIEIYESHMQERARASDRDPDERDRPRSAYSKW